MIQPLNPPESKHFPGSISVILSGILLGGLWLGLINQLRVEWTINLQYSYGWGVPFLSLYLFFKRWESRPKPSPFTVEIGLFLTTALLLICLLPLRLIQEANPDWRLVSWVYGLLVVGMSMIITAVIGGLPWVRHFFFPAFFILMAVPWPTPMEQFTIQSLMKGVASVTVEIMNWAGVFAVREGNLIRLAQDSVGVNEACSGVRSLQGMIMAALFLGELYRDSFFRRIVLLVFGIASAILFNLIRAVIMTVLVHKKGSEILDQWHDPTGLVVLVLAFLNLVLFRFLMVKWGATGDAELEPALNTVRNTTPIPSGLIPVRYLNVVIIWLVFVEISTEAWFRVHEKLLPEPVRWTVDLDSSQTSVQTESIHEQVRLLLRYDDGWLRNVKRKDGSLWQVYYFQWKPGRTSAQLARSHSPEVCLPSTGWRQSGSIETAIVILENVEIPFQFYQFERGPNRVYVFFVLWEDTALTSSSHTGNDLSRRSRFQAVLNGERHLGQRLLEVVMDGHQDSSRAVDDFKAFIKNNIRIL